MKRRARDALQSKEIQLIPTSWCYWDRCLRHIDLIQGTVTLLVYGHPEVNKDAVTKQVIGIPCPIQAGVPSCMRISSSRVTITGDRTAAEGAGVLGTTSLGRGVADHDTWERGEADGAKRGASSIKSRSSDLGVEESKREAWVLMMNSILVTERCVDYRENDWDDRRESLSI